MQGRSIAPIRIRPNAMESPLRPSMPAGGPRGILPVGSANLVNSQATQILKHRPGQLTGSICIGYCNVLSARSPRFLICKIRVYLESVQNMSCYIELYEVETQALLTTCAIQGDQGPPRPNYPPAQPSRQTPSHPPEPPQSNATQASGMSSYGRPPAITGQATGPPGSALLRGTPSIPPLNLNPRCPHQY